MIVDITVTDDTPPTALTENFVRKVLEFRATTPWPDGFTQRNWEGFTYGPNNPLTNTITITKTYIANDIYFFCGSLQYLWIDNDGATHFLQDGLFGCCRLDRLDEIESWHLYLGRNIQDIFNAGIGAGLPAQIPTCDTTGTNGYFGMSGHSGSQVTEIANTSTQYVDFNFGGNSNISEVVWIHTVGGCQITDVAGTVIDGTVPFGGANPQLQFPVHKMWAVIPYDSSLNIPSPTVMNAQALPEGLDNFFGTLNPLYDIANYQIWGDLVVIGVAQKTQTGKEATGGPATYSGAVAIPFLTGTSQWNVSSNNYDTWTENSFMDALTGSNAPATGGGSTAILRDITFSQTTLTNGIPGTGGGGLPNQGLGFYMAVGSAYQYLDPNNVNSDGTVPLVEAGVNNMLPGAFGQSRNYSSLQGRAGPVVTQDTSTATNLASSDNLFGAYYSDVQELSLSQQPEEPILLRLQVLQFGAGKPWENFTHITYHFTNLNLLNSVYGLMTPAADSKQIGPLISTNTTDIEYQAFPTTEERGYQVPRLNNRLPIQGCKVARQDSQNVQIVDPIPPTPANNYLGFSVICNNIPTYSPDIRGFAGSFSPVDDTSADWETTRPFMLLYDTNTLGGNNPQNSGIRVPYAQLQAGGEFDISVSDGCFFDSGRILQTYLSNPVIRNGAEQAPAAPASYTSGGIMNIDYDVDRNQWLLTLSAIQDGVVFNLPAYTMAANANLQRFAYFRPNANGVAPLSPVLAQVDLTTAPAGIPQSTSYVFVNCAGGTERLAGYTLGGNFVGSIDGVGGTTGTPGEPGEEGALQLTNIDGVSGRTVAMWVDYVLYDGLDSLIATIVQELGLAVTIENVEWYKRTMIHKDALNMSQEEISSWIQAQQAQYRDTMLRAEREGRQRQRKSQQKKLAGDMIEGIESHMDVDKIDFIERDFIERNLKQMTDFPDQDKALEHQIITDEQWNELDSLYGKPVPKKETVGERKQKAEKGTESDAEDDKI